ncbi:MMPL family transporter [Microbacterium dauci]|uniref:Efflux RND transporter permease subunit n=1 Tax=Microbacterium dauci TaxID=3048008 RepID=A0ABT6ZGL4_9MICO|nr:efflux RND transporter permease subunit [Microbacterium sp. LX3-4]MDJ1114885.1 efflux RND transporter permease subunit [Microbacterium sp. LX3-4]
MSASRTPSPWLRIALPIVLVVIWLAGGSIGGPYFGKVDEVATNDQSSFLPQSAESTQVQQRLDDFTGGDTIPALVVFEGSSALDAADLEQLQSMAETLGGVEGVDEVSPAIPSDDGEAAQIVVSIDSSGEITEIVTALREAVTADAPSGVEGWVTGPAGFTADLASGFTGIDGLLLLVALGAVFVILIVVYRSPLLPILVLLTSVFALCVALLTVWWLAKAEVFVLNGQVQGILFILVIGAATDYALLYVARHREAIGEGRSRWDAAATAWKGSVEPILASGATVIAGLLCLLLSDLASNRALGPIASIGIVFSILAALTFLPALLALVGKAAFWPFIPTHGAVSLPDDLSAPARGGWARLARFVARRARVVWIVSTVVLLVAAVGLTQLKADGVPASELVLGQSEARDGQAVLGEHFAAGSGSPLYVLASEEAVADVVGVLSDEDGVDAVGAVSADSATGQIGVELDGGDVVYTVQGPPGEAPAPTVDAGDVLLVATLVDAADSLAAEETVRDLRAAFASADIAALVGGTTATDLDTNDTSIRDRTVIIPVILVVVLLILMLLLRSVLAPVLLILSVVVSFAAALGVSALVFDGVFGFPGADPSVPLYGFVFLVALGIDYNIFLMSRVREESIAHGTRRGILRGLVTTGGVITSAGLVLAATFAALGVIQILFLVQIAFIVAFGVLLDTFVVRSLLVPALAYDIGPAIWWPSKLASAPENPRDPATMSRAEYRRTLNT